MLQGAGFNVVGLCVSVKPQDFVEGVKAHKPIILGISAPLTTTLPKMEETIAALKKKPVFVTKSKSWLAVRR